jgi:hypothetical protein
MTASKTFLIVAAATATLAAGCGRKDAALTDPSVDASKTAASGYLAPPQVLAVRGQPGGAIQIEGVGTPDARIRGVTADRKSYGATVDKKGRFSLEVPSMATPTLIGIAEESGHSVLQADGLLFVPPDAPQKAVILRSGAPSKPLAPAPDLIAATDFDAGGGAAVAGVTAPNATVDVSLDGGTAVRTTADARGVYGARLGLDKSVSAGAHNIRVSSHGQSADRNLSFSAGTTTAAAFFNPVREPDGWRVAWSLRDGGVQTTFVLTGRT